jgi:hypothetical protein
MNEPNLPTLMNALDQSIQWLSEGRTVSDCLRHYPDLADQLAPLLETGTVVQRIQIRNSEIAAAQDRVRFRLHERQRRRSQHNNLLRSGIAALLVVSIGMMLVWQAPALSVVFSRLQGTPIAAATETPPPTMTIISTIPASPSNTPTPTPTRTATPPPQEPIIQITRYTTPTLGSPAPPIISRATNTARPTEPGGAD